MLKYLLIYKVLRYLHDFPWQVFIFNLILPFNFLLSSYLQFFFLICYISIINNSEFCKCSVKENLENMEIWIYVVIPLDSWGSLTNRRVYRLHRADQVCLEDSATTTYARTYWIYQSKNWFPSNPWCHHQ